MNFYYWVGYHLSRLLGRLLFRLRVIHPERMIQSGPVILAMNHESYLDPPFAGIGCRRAIYFLARKTLLEVPLLGWILPKLNVIPVVRVVAGIISLHSSSSSPHWRADLSNGVMYCAV